MLTDNVEEMLVLFTCTHCNFSTTTSVNLDSHITEIHPLTCYLVSKTTSDDVTNNGKASVSTITLDETAVYPFECEQCTLTLETEHELKNHSEVCHQFQCKFCPSKLNTDTELNNHMVTHKQIDIVNTCHHCDVIIKDNLYLICDKCN